jgi:hypothetical protein
VGLAAVLALAVVVGLAGRVPEAGAAVPIRYPPLGPVVIAEPLPGFTVAAPGPTNGPLTAAGFAAQSSDPAQATAEFDALADQPGFAAELRLWTDVHGPAKGANDVVITLFRVTVAAPRSELAAGLALPYREAAGASPFTVPSIPGAEGFTVPVATSGGVTEQTVVFTYGVYVTVVQLASSDAVSNPAPLSPADAIGVAFDQYQAVVHAPGIPERVRRGVPAPATDRGGGLHLGGVSAVLAGVAVLAAVAWLADRRRRPRLTAAADPWSPDGVLAAMGAVPVGRPPSAGGVSPPPVLLPGTRPGWQPDPSSPDSTVRYWDGERWTDHVARRTAVG